MSFYNEAHHNDKYINHVIRTTSCGRPNYSPTGRLYDSYYHSTAGMKTMQFLPEMSDCTYSNDNLTNSSFYVINSGNPPRKTCDPHILRFRTEFE